MDALPALRYARAEAFLEWNLARHVPNWRITPTFLPDGDRFVYDVEGAERDDRRLVNPTTGYVSHPTDVELPSAPDLSDVPAGAQPTDDGSRWVREIEGDLVLGGPGLEERTLTDDGARLDGYGVVPDSALVRLAMQRAGTPLPAVAAWAPDRRRLVTHRLDQTRVRRLPLVESAPRDGSPVPVLHQLRQPLPLDEHLATARLVVIDTDSGEQVPIGDAPLHVPFLSPIELGWVWWGATGDALWFLREGRGAASLALCHADPRTGSVRTVVQETSDAYVEPSAILPWPRVVRVLERTNEVLWRSDRTGWSHLDLYDAGTGEHRHAVTEGPWEVLDILHADEVARTALVVGVGREPGNPYQRHLYRVGLDDGSVDRLTPGDDRDHRVWVSPSGRFVVDTASTPSTAPVHTVRDAAEDGRPVAELATADLSILDELGWHRPEPFTVPSLDGSTALHGMLFFPSDFDEAGSYALIDHVYPGPQLWRTPTTFSLDSREPFVWPGAWRAQALAELGFVVMTLDGVGTPLRGRAFHLLSSGRLQDAGGIDEHVAAIRRLTRERPWIDADRIGIVGHSAGGYAAARSMLLHPDVYKAGVAASGPHDLRRYLAYWGEKYQGLDPAAYREQANHDLAHRLDGPLLLLHGELDDNVSPTETLSFAAALFEAGKNVEVAILPGQPHDCYDTGPYLQKVWDFFCRHLLDLEPPRYVVRGR